MNMFDPPHPGEILREECLVPLALTVTKGAEVLGVTRQTLNNLVNEKSGISPEMAVRLERAFGLEAGFWLRLQMSFDLAQTRKNGNLEKIKRFAPDKRDKAA
jgi:antitoxin HigA-1